jgi:serine/threonine protein phosphatase 1
MFSYLEAMKQQRMEHSYLLEYPPEGRALVIPDIHGCVKTFRALVEKVELTRKDYLFLLGDFINRGPDNAGVVDSILYLLLRGYQVFPLRGNHEEMLLQSHQRSLKAKPGTPPGPVSLRNRGLVDKNRRILPAFLPFFYSLPYYYELPDYYLVHAGFDFKKPRPFSNYQMMPWIRPFTATHLQTRGKTVVVGHEPKMRPLINQHIAQEGPVIYLDNGCVFKTRLGMGNLLCLNLHTRELIAQPNID